MAYILQVSGEDRKIVAKLVISATNLHLREVIAYNLSVNSKVKDIMIRTDGDIQHGLAHLMIGEAFIANTIENDRFSAAQLDQFFGTFRESHRGALGQFTTRAAEIVGYDEHHELDDFGPHGKFAGKLSLRESGLAVVETELHHAAPAGLNEALKASCATAVAVLRG